MATPRRGEHLDYQNPPLVGGDFHDRVRVVLDDQGVIREAVAASEEDRIHLITLKCLRRELESSPTAYGERTTRFNI
jgi:hypothetical protein